ncbi:condensation domain-containing protein [Pedobacter psychrodurus]|uniref:condensation domain-containing protein n=1 Tax=Pedobacter psychrodurus TaxID=2530456 RepID=UPI002930EE63|nr:condensation domain-containing protein [Pedobacter psychrodurus]
MAKECLYGDGKSPFNIVIPFKIKGEIKEDDLRFALFRIQKKHPWLTAAIRIDEDKRPWFVTNLTEDFKIPVRMVNRVDDNHWAQESISEWKTVFDATNAPLCRMVWIKGKEVSEFLMVYHHCLCDGTAALSILTELLQLLDEPDTDIGREIPIMGVEDVIPEKVLNSYRNRTKNGLIGKIATLALWIIPIKKVAVERKNDFMINWKLGQDFTKQIIQFCKANQFTVNTLLSAAVLTAFKEVRKEKAFNKISLPVDIRNFNPIIKKDHIFAFGLMIVLSLLPEKDFLENAKALQKYVNDKSSKLNPYSLMMMMEACHPALKNFTNFLKYGKSSNDCMFSNLGKIDIPYQYQNFQVETIFSPSVMGPLGNTTTMIASTYRNQMDFTFVASEGYVPFVEAEAIIRKGNRYS